MLKSITLLLTVSLLGRTWAACPPTGDHVMPHERDATKYVVCREGTELLLSCDGGTAYNPLTEGCVLISDSGRTASKTTPIILPTSTEESSAVTKDRRSKTLVDNKSASNALFSKIGFRSKSQVVEPKFQKALLWTCPNNNPTISVYAHEEECAVFYVCFGGVATAHFCDHGFEFDANVQGCSRISANGCTASKTTLPPPITTEPPVFSCPSDNSVSITVFPDRHSCAKFYVCFKGVASTLFCDPGYEFSEKYLICVVSNSGCDANGIETTSTEDPWYTTVTTEDTTYPGTTEDPWYTTVTTEDTTYPGTTEDPWYTTVTTEDTTYPGTTEDPWYTTVTTEDTTYPGTTEDPWYTTVTTEDTTYPGTTEDPWYTTVTTEDTTYPSTTEDPWYTTVTTEDTTYPGTTEDPWYTTVTTEDTTYPGTTEDPWYTTVTTEDTTYPGTTEDPWYTTVTTEDTTYPGTTEDPWYTTVTTEDTTYPGTTEDPWYTTVTTEDTTYPGTTEDPWYTTVTTEDTTYPGTTEDPWYTTVTTEDTTYPGTTEDPWYTTVTTEDTTYPGTTEDPWYTTVTTEDTTYPGTTEDPWYTTVTTDTIYPDTTKYPFFSREATEGTTDPGTTEYPWYTTSATSSPTFRCPSNDNTVTIFGDKDDCSVMYVCFYGEVAIFKCDAGQEFDEKSKKCVPIAFGGCTHLQGNFIATL